MLQVKSLRVGYSGADVLNGITLEVAKGSFVALVGTNGAGKSTTMRALSGMLTPRGGSIRVGGREMKSLPSHDYATAGVAHVPEGRRVFSAMTVEDNLLMGAYPRRGKSGRAEILREIEEWFDRLPHLGRRRRQQAGSLSGGEQQMLAIARALMMKPRLLLIDEPSLGLAPKLVDDVFSMLRELKSQGISMLVVEQFANRALELADYAYLMDRGAIVAHGVPDSLHESSVLSSYLGDGQAAGAALH
jgi:branched-chain amino acid transport system ATP-binding protein